METINTKVWYVDKDVDEYDPQIVDIGDKLRAGEVIAFPTETVYGLGANAKDSDAVRKIFEAKGRPSDNPLIVHIATREQLHDLVGELNQQSEQLIDQFWPGPLTMIFPRKGGISDYVTSLPTIAVRMPDHAIALAIIKAAGVPIAAPSANRSGKPSPTKAEHVWNDLHGRIHGIVDGGEAGFGVESTVLDLTGDKPMILRPGGITKEQLQEVIGEVSVDPALVEKGDKPKAPGMKYTHYAPDAEMWIIQGEDHQKVMQEVRRLAEQARIKGQKVGILTTEDRKSLYQEYADLLLAYGSRDSLYPFAKYIYDSLRQFDHESIDFIITEGVPETGIGLAIMNRLKKAAGGNILVV